MTDTATSHRPDPGRSVISPSPRSTVRSARRRIGVTAVVLTALTAVVVDTLQAGDNHSAPGRLLAGYAVAWTLFVAAVWTIRKVPARASTFLVLIGSAAVALAGLTAQPRTSNDMYRYAWDGRVQAAGISPYAYPPAAPELARLRDPWLFPTQETCKGWGLTHTGSGLCVRINRPTVPTIYPPVAEGWYLAVHTLSPPGSHHKPLQVGGCRPGLRHNPRPAPGPAPPR